MAKKTITITLDKGELLYEVENKTYLTGRSREDGNNYAAVSHMQVTEEPEKQNQVLRFISNAVDTLKTHLSEWTDSDVVSSDNALDTATGGSYTFTLLMPNNYNQSVVDSITASMHSYVVNIAVAEWFLITNKAESSDYATLAASNLEATRQCLNKRVRPSRPAMCGC